MTVPGLGSTAVTLFSTTTVATEEPDHDQDRHDRVDDLGERVVLRLHRHVVGAAPVAEDGPEDQQEDEAAHDDAGDEEALPEVEGGAGLVVAPL